MARIIEANRAAAALLGVGKRFLAASRWPPTSRAATAGSSARRSTGCAWATRAGWPTGRCSSGGAAAVLTLAVTVEPIQGPTVGWRPCAGCCAGWSRRRRPARPSRPGTPPPRTTPPPRPGGPRGPGRGRRPRRDGAGAVGRGRAAARRRRDRADAGRRPGPAVRRRRLRRRRRRLPAGPGACGQGTVRARLPAGAERPGPLAWTAAGAGPSWPRRPPSTPWARPWPRRSGCTGGRSGPACWCRSGRRPGPTPSGGRGLRLGAGRDAGAGGRGPARRRAVAPAPGPGGGGAGQGRPDGPPGHRRRRRRAPAAAARPAAPGARWPRSRPASYAASAPVPRRRPRLR